MQRQRDGSGFAMKCDGGGLSDGDGLIFPLPSDRRSNLHDTDCVADQPRSVVERGAQRPAVVVGTVGPVKKATKTGVDSDRLPGTFYIDVVTAGKADEKFDVLFEQQRVAVEQTSIFSESRYGATVEKKVSALQLGHCDQVAARALSSGKRSVPSIPSATSSSCILRNEALWALISAHSSGVTDGYGEAPLLDAPLLETMSSSLGMPQIVAPASTPNNPSRHPT